MGLAIHTRRGLLPLALVGALGLMAYASARSDALDRARQIAHRTRDPQGLARVVQLSLEQLDRQPWNRDAALLAALTLSRLDHAAIAEPYYQRAGELGNDDAHTRAYSILRSNDRELAIAAYKSILDRWPNDARAAKLLGGIYYSRKQYSEALATARLMQRLPEVAADGHRLAAEVLHATGNPEEAIVDYRRVLELNPGLSGLEAEVRLNFYFHFAFDLLTSGQAEEARDVLSEALKRNESGSLRTLLGRAHLLLGQLDRAEACWREVVAASPDVGVAWAELGRLELARGEVELSIVSLERAARLAPRDRSIAYSLRSAYLRDGRTSQAERLRPLLESAPADATPGAGMGPRDVP